LEKCLLNLKSCIRNNMAQSDQTIKLHGREYSITSPFEPQYTLKLAKYCDTLMKNIGKTAATTDYLNLSVLTLLQVAHNYFQQVENSKGPNPDAETEFARLIELIDNTGKEVAAMGAKQDAQDK
jgi:cell division protein ZapA (FtsZ GTPase activity inhibitor)